VIGYLSGQDGAILPAQDTGLSRKENLLGFGVLSHIINPLLTMLVQSRWLYIGLIFFLRVYGPQLRLGP